MDPARIAALLHPFLDSPLAARALDQISIYIDLLLRWNARINLTSIRNPEQIVTRHFGESLFLAVHVFPATSRVERAPSPAPALQPSRSLNSGTPGQESLPPIPAEPSPSSTASIAQPCVLDIGSGAGFPALPLKIWTPQIDLTLVEASHKKAAFLREVIRALTLTDVNVIVARAEVLAASGAPRADLVTLRAIERFDFILPIATKFLAPKGRLALLIGAGQLPLLSRLTPDLTWPSPLPLPASRTRVLAVGTLQPR